MTVEIIPRVLLQRMQICLSPRITVLFKSAPVGLASHEVILIGKKDKNIPPSALVQEKGTPVRMVNPTNLERGSLLSICTALIKNPRKPCLALNTGLRAS